jgi:hypothetical protein
VILALLLTLGDGLVDTVALRVAPPPKLGDATDVTDCVDAPLDERVPALLADGRTVAVPGASDALAKPLGDALALVTADSDAGTEGVGVKVDVPHEDALSSEDAVTRAPVAEPRPLPDCAADTDAERVADAQPLADNTDDALVMTVRVTRAPVAVAASEMDELPDIEGVLVE